MTLPSRDDAKRPSDDASHDQTVWMRRLRALEDENAKLKTLLAEAILDNAILKDIASVKW
jgi:hypothetical protein